MSIEAQQPNYPNKVVRSFVLAGAVLASGMTLNGDSGYDQGEACISRLVEDKNSSDIWDEIAVSYCKTYGKLALEGFDEDGYTEFLPIESSAMPQEHIDAVEEHIAPVRPFSAMPNFTELIVGWDADAGLFSGSVENGHPFVSLDDEAHNPSNDNGRYLQWIMFHETAHTVFVDDIFAEAYEDFNAYALAEAPEFFSSGRNNYGIYPPLDTSTVCPDGYSDTLYGLFDESSYTEMDCENGHPYESHEEFKASAITAMHLYSGRFIEKYNSLKGEDKVWAQCIIIDLLDMLKRRNNDAKSLAQLIPQNVQDAILTPLH